MLGDEVEVVVLVGCVLVLGWDAPRLVVFRRVVFLRLVLVRVPFDFNVRISRFKDSISRRASLRSAVNSEASLLKTRESSCIAFLVLLGFVSMVACLRLARSKHGVTLRIGVTGTTFARPVTARLPSLRDKSLLHAIPGRETDVPQHPSFAQDLGL